MTTMMMMINKGLILLPPICHFTNLSKFVHAIFTKF